MRHDTRKKRALSGPFRDCLLHWLARAARAGARALDAVQPFIGKLTLDRIHDGTLATAHYSVAQVAELVEALNRITD